MNNNDVLTNRLMYICVVVSAGILTYHDAVNAGLFSLDDREILLNIQSTERSLKSLFFSGGGMYFRPLIALSYKLDLSLFGKAPVAIHLVNILIHLVNGLLVYYLTLELMRDSGRKDKYAFIASLLFVLHPLNSEAVVWIAARTDLLCCLFFLLTVILLVKKENDPDLFALAGMFLMFLFSLFAKEASIGLLAIAPIYFWLRKDAVPLKNAVLINSSLFLAGAVYMVLRSGRIGVVDRGTARVLSFIEPSTSTIGDFISAYGFYLGKLFYPFPLNFAIVDINKALSIAVLALVLPLCAVLFYRNERLRLPLLILLTGIVPPIMALLGKLAWTPYAERYLYLPMVGFSISAAIVLLTYGRKIPYIVIVAAVMLLAIPTISRVVLWTDPVALWRDAAEKSPQFHRAHVGLAVALIEEQEYEEAKEHLDTAAAMGFKRDYLWQNYAAMYYAKKEYEKYEKFMLKAAAVSKKSTKFYLGIIGSLEHIYPGKGERYTRYRRAIRYYLMAYEKDPAYIQGLYNAGKLYWIMGDEKNARLYLNKFVQQERDNMYKPFAVKILKKLDKESLVKQ